MESLKNAHIQKKANESKMGTEKNDTNRQQIQYPLLFTILLCHFTFLKTYISISFANQKKSKKDFQFYEER